MPQASVLQAVSTASAHLREQVIGRQISDTVPRGPWWFTHSGVSITSSRTVSKAMTLRKVDFMFKTLDAFAQLRPHVPKAVVYVTFRESIVAMRFSHRRHSKRPCLQRNESTRVSSILV